MALLKPFAYTLTQGWGPSSRLDEPAGYAELGRFWWNPVAGLQYYKHFHPGLDLAAAEGTPIEAGEAGTVIQAGVNPQSPVSGIRLEVQISPGTSYGHGHLSRLGPGIAVGAHVGRGQVIGYVGHTGGATGPHSHYFVQSVVPGNQQVMIYDPSLFFAGGANANDPRIAPPTPCKPIRAKVAYPTPRQAQIAPNKTIYGYDPARPGAAVQHFTSPKGSSFWVNGMETVSWPSPCVPTTLPHGSFLHGDPLKGGVFANLLIVPGQVSPSDGKPW